MSKIINEENSQLCIKDRNGKDALIIRESGNCLEIHTKYYGVYGLGEKFNQVNQIGKTVINQVVEKFCNQGEYSYCVTPFFVTDNGIGIYVETKEKTVFHFENEIICEIPKTSRIHVFTGSIEKIVCEYMKIFGKAALPPDYAFGIWISANHWKNQKDVEKQLGLLKRYKYPASVIVLEAWSDEATFYIWNGADYIPKKNQEKIELDQFDFSNSSYWPNPNKMIEEIHEQGLKLVLWQIPVLKKQDKDEIFCQQLQNDKDYAIENGLCVNNENGTVYEIPKGNWFEGSYIPDFTNKKTKEFWFSKRQYLLDMGVDGFKTDGGEFIYAESVKFSDGATGLEGKNQYCQDYVNAYSEFITNQNVLFSRAGYTGAHTTPIHWAGDHQSTNQELKNVLIAGLSAAMSGITYWSFDIGGFAGELPSLDLYRRATQFACFCPIMQWHSEPDGGQFKDMIPGQDGNNERSPWNIAAFHQKPEYVDEVRYWHELRMSILPYILNEARKASDQYKPMMRPMIYAFENDEQSINIEDEYMFGDYLLVAPLMEENQISREVYLPDDTWFGFFSGEKYLGKQYVSSEKERMPVFVKSGSAIPIKEKNDFVINLYGERGNNNIIINQNEVEIQWEGTDVSVKGVMEEHYKLCFVL